MLILLSLWRLLIVAFALVGISTVPGGGFGQLQYLSQFASLVAAIVYVALLVYPLFTRGRRHEPRTPWLRGATTVLLALVSVAFLTMLSGDLSDTSSLFEHLLTPLVVLIDWIAVGSDQRNVRWWFPITWLAMPLAYLVFYVAYVGDGLPLYPFLDPNDADFAGIVLAFLTGVLAFGYVLYGIGKLRAAVSGSRDQTSMRGNPVQDVSWGPGAHPSPGWPAGLHPPQNARYGNTGRGQG
ncbi:hypothetical protein [Actinomadura sp. HBU206391]|uniref:hypothetical protein n=1 Tax=Actinomadura sp. HBU206391 TaxID=2731692 RepID=UPI00164F8078|nr:hypothetical protein [Actinomadura sp. HBU206391]MBC6456626.1 hypothetical protein [Actinomadura sp. HBU206391]